MSKIISLLFIILISSFPAMAEYELDRSDKKRIKVLTKHYFTAMRKCDSYVCLSPYMEKYGFESNETKAMTADEKEYNYDLLKMDREDLINRPSRYNKGIEVLSANQVKVTYSKGVGTPKEKSHIFYFVRIHDKWKMGH